MLSTFRGRFSFYQKICFSNQILAGRWLHLTDCSSLIVHSFSIRDGFGTFIVASKAREGVAVFEFRREIHGPNINICIHPFPSQEYRFLQRVLQGDKTVSAEV